VTHSDRNDWPPLWRPGRRFAQWLGGKADEYRGVHPEATRIDPARGEELRHGRPRDVLRSIDRRL